MKRTVHCCRPKACAIQSSYPNAADSHYFAGKALEILTAVASGFCFIGAMVFLVVLT